MYPTNLPNHNNKCVCCGNEIVDFSGPPGESQIGHCRICNGYPCYHCGSFIARQHPKYTVVICPSCGSDDVALLKKDGWG